MHREVVGILFRRVGVSVVRARELTFVRRTSPGRHRKRGRSQGVTLLVVVNSYMVSAAQSARRIVVNSSPTAMVEEPQLSRMPTTCLVKPVAARRDFVGSGGIFSYWGLRLQPGLLLPASRALV